MRIGILYENGIMSEVVLAKTRAELVRFLQEHGNRWEIEFLHPRDREAEQIIRDLGKCDMYVRAKQH